LELGFGDGEVLLAVSDFAFIFEYVEGRNCLQVQFLSGGIERLVGEVQRCTLDLLIFVGANEVPVHICNLRDRANDLQLKGLVRNFLIIFGNAEITQVGSETETGEELLLKEDAVVRIELGSKQRVEAVVGNPVVGECNGQAGTGGEGLGKVEVAVDGVGTENRNAVDREVGERFGVVLETAIGGDGGVVGGNRCTRAEGGLDEARGSCAGAASTAAGTSCTGACRAGSEAADAAAGGVLYDACVNAAEDAAGLRAEDVGARDRDVVAGDGEIEIVLERKGDRILQGELEHAVVDE